MQKSNDLTEISSDKRLLKALLSVLNDISIRVTPFRVDYEGDYLDCQEIIEGSHIIAENAARYWFKAVNGPAWNHQGALKELGFRLTTWNTKASQASPGSHLVLSTEEQLSICQFPLYLLPISSDILYFCFKLGSGEGGKNRWYGTKSDDSRTAQQVELAGARISEALREAFKAPDAIIKHPSRKGDWLTVAKLPITVLEASAEGTADQAALSDLKTNFLRGLCHAMIIGEKILADSLPKQVINNMPVESNLFKKVIDQSLPNQRLNCIMFGPPGTGKTYRLQQLLHSEYRNEVTQEEVPRQSRDERVRQLLAESTPLWHVLAAALYDQEQQMVSDLMSHELVKLRLSESTHQNPRSFVWNQLQSHTHSDNPHVKVKDRSQDQLFWKEDGSTWRIDDRNGLLQKLKIPQLVTAYQELSAEKPQRRLSVDHRAAFVSFHQNFTYEDFVEGIKPVLTGPSQTERLVTALPEKQDQKVLYQLEKGILWQACEEALRLAGYPNFTACREDTFEERRRRLMSAPAYGLFIDEINRANVSGVFGELITLIEEDKRAGADNELWITLPYSKTPFSIPLNLRIIGTMNTADRSVEALDTALRRRFSFIEMAPQPDLLPTQLTDANINLQLLLAAINERLEQVLGRDHLIGHAFLMRVQTFAELQAAFASSIIPLLQEFFYSDWERIGQIVGADFFEADHQPRFSLLPFGARSTRAGKALFRFRPISQLPPESFRSIYA